MRDLPDILDQGRDAVVHGDDDIADVVERLQCGRGRARSRIARPRE